jgi:hypothetical protein
VQQPVVGQALPQAPGGGEGVGPGRGESSSDGRLDRLGLAGYPEQRPGSGQYARGPIGEGADPFLESEHRRSREQAGSGVLAGEGVVDDTPEQVGLIGEAQKHGAFGAVGPLGDLPDRGEGVALLGEQLARRGDDRSLAALHSAIYRFPLASFNHIMHSI